MKALYDAIVTKYNASAALKAVTPGGIHREVIPQGLKRFPCLVMKALPQLPAETFDDTGEDIPMQFEVVSRASNDDEIDNIFTKLTAAFDFCTLSVSGYTFIYMQRTMSRPFWNDEEEVWQYSVQYRIGLE